VADDEVVHGFERNQRVHAGIIPASRMKEKR